MSTQPQIVQATPPQIEIVSKTILMVVGLNAQAFSGASNPTTLWRQMVAAGPDVFSYFREVEEKDTAVGSALETRKLLLMARDAQVQAADTDSNEAMGFAEGLENFIERISNWRMALWEMLDAPGYGYAVEEILWRIAPEGIAASLVGRPQELFRFGQMTEPQTGPLVLSQFVGGSGQPVPLNKFMVASYQPRHGDRRGRPILRRVFWASWMKRNCLRLFLKFLEKGGNTVVVKYPAGAGDDEKNKALEAAFAIAEEVAAAVPEGFTLLAEALQGHRTRDGNDFRTMFDYFDAELTRLCLGQTLTTRGAEQGKGTQALGAVHEGLLHEMVKGDALDLEETLNEQLFRPWLLWTYGDAALDPKLRPWWTIQKEPPKDRAMNLQVLEGAKRIGLDVTKRQAHEDLDIRTAQQEEEILQQDPTLGDLAQLGTRPPVAELGQGDKGGQE